ncbi:hypothetical protein C8F01DRAFT_1243723 [Mycena amicta]|nr:hypothetical protein C8F01DRAFT_1243723 [Mycena amicta]
MTRLFFSLRLRPLLPVSAPAFRHVHLQPMETAKLTERLSLLEAEKVDNEKQLAVSVALREQADKQADKVQKMLLQEIRNLNDLRVGESYKNAANLGTISTLEIQLRKAKNNLDLRSGMEIITETLRHQTKLDAQLRANLPLHLQARLPPPLHLGAGVQAVLDALVQGAFDTATAIYSDSQATVVAAVTAGGGISAKSISYSVKTLYATLSKHHHVGISDVIEIREDYVMAEAIVAMSIILFAKRLFGCQLDAKYINNQGTLTLCTVFFLAFGTDIVEVAPPRMTTQTGPRTTTQTAADIVVDF